MANEQLDAFLAEGAADAAAPAPAPEPTTPAPPESRAPEPKAAPESTSKTPEPDDEPPSAIEGEPIVPRRAFESIRRERQDWKEKAARAEGELAELRRQFEAAQRAAQTPPPPPVYQAPIDPVADPQGFIARVQNVMLNERLNSSEQMLRREIGSEKVNQIIADFKQAAGEDKSLFDKLYAQPDPYGWAAKQVERIRMLRDVGDDPAAYRARIEAEARAKWEAETAQPARPALPAMQPSLATARSVAGRTEGAWTGEPSLEDVLAPIQNRKSQNGAVRRRF